MYYNFYNNGGSGEFRIYVTQEENSVVEVLLARGSKSRPPFDDSYLIKKEGIGRVVMEVTEDSLRDASNKKS